MFVVFVFARRNAHIERGCELRIAFMIPGRKWFFVPEAAELLVRAAAPDRFYTVIRLIRIYQDADVFARRLAADFDPLDIVVQPVAANLDFEGAISDLERFVDRSFVLRM